jgi:hypothetical protein
MEALKNAESPLWELGLEVLRVFRLLRKACPDGL